MVDVSIKKTEPSDIAFIKMHGPYAQIPVAIRKLYTWAALHRLRPTGGPSAMYYTVPENGDDSYAEWEVYTPIAGDHEPRAADKKGRGVRRHASQLVAATTHIGPYDGVATTYDALGVWVTENGYRMVGPPEESYLSDPKTTSPEEYVTEIRFPVQLV